MANAKKTTIIKDYIDSQIRVEINLVHTPGTSSNQYNEYTAYINLNHLNGNSPVTTGRAFMELGMREVKELAEAISAAIFGDGSQTPYAISSRNEDFQTVVEVAEGIIGLTVDCPKATLTAELPFPKALALKALLDFVYETGMELELQRQQAMYGSFRKATSRPAPPSRMPSAWKQKVKTSPPSVTDSDPNQDSSPF